MRSVQISVVIGDATSFKADVLALKYAQNLYGLDAAVHRRLVDRGLKPKLPHHSDFTLCETGGIIGAKLVLFVAVEPLQDFRYAEIRNFSNKVLVSLAQRDVKVRSLALTIHGANYGLDEIEAFESQLAGTVEAISEGHFPEDLESITFVERDHGRAERLESALKKLLPNESLAIDGQSPVGLEAQARSTLRAAGDSSNQKPHVFVAMPFLEEMGDVFHYGIQGPVNAAGMLCERADLSSFTGDVMDWVRRRIATSKLVIADLSTANPNVYLEVGYAWGRSIPTILLTKAESDLKFDVKGQRYISYKSIKHLEDTLSRELRGLAEAG